MRTTALTQSRLLQLLGALEILHTQRGGQEFPQRLFQALRRLFKDSVFSLELFPISPRIAALQHTDVPCEASRLAAIMSRVSEVAPTEHPAFPHLIRGEEGPLLLSQLISDRQLRNTNLYHDAYRQLDIRYQIILPLTTGTHVGGVTISRGTSDFTEPETALCAPLARQVILAFDTDQALNHSREASHEVQKTDFTHLRRLGLTVRESEVLWWIGQGKRDREIALILGISPRTINRHVCGLLTKLNAETRTAALARIG